MVSGNIERHLADKSLPLSIVLGIGAVQEAAPLGAFFGSRADGPLRLGEALTCYDRALEINPRYAQAWFKKGAALHNAGRFEQALACFEQAQRLGDPQAAEAIAVCRRELRM
jgi:tetratricopeptide (TPR) repeat protein